MVPHSSIPVQGKQPLAVLAGPIRSVSGFANAKWNMLSRFSHRYIVLRACMLEIFEDDHSRTPLFSACVAGATLLPIPQKREVQIRVNGYRVIIQWHTDAELRACRAAFEFANRRIDDFYKIVAHRQLGKGRASEVIFAFDIATGVHTAVKVMSRESSRPTELIFAEKEVAIRMTVQHPTIVQTLDIFESPYDLFVVMEFMGGGTLSRRLAKMNAPVAEYEARIIMDRLFDALRHLHSRGIVHRNVKPENILLDFAEESRWAETAKLSDLSLVCELDDPDVVHKVVGTPEFLAPEASTMVNGPDAQRQIVFGTEIDMWAAGVMLYNILSLQLPFDGESTPEILRRVRTGRYEFPEEYFSHVSPEARSLIRALLNLDRRKRLTAVTVMEHAWFTGGLHDLAHESKEQRYLSTEYSKLRSAAIAVRAMLRMARGHCHMHMIPSCGGRRFQSNIGGVDISPGKNRVPVEPPLPTSRISNSSTVLSRSSTEELCKKYDLIPFASPLASRSAIARRSDAASDDSSTPPHSRSCRNKRQFLRSESSSAMMPSRVMAAEKEDRVPTRLSNFGSNPALRFRGDARSASLRTAADWEKLEAKSEKKWRLRETWENRAKAIH